MDEMPREEVEQFLDEQKVGRLGCHDAGTTHVVPLIYAREGDALYVMTMLGEKVRVMRRNASVCFEVDEYDGATGSWRSVIVQGRYEELADEAGRAKALAVLSARHGMRRTKGDAPPAGADAPTLVAFRVRIESATGRAARRA